MIFVDTSYWVALVNPRDDHHEQADALYRQHAHEPLTTSVDVRGESWTFLRRRAGHAVAVRFLDLLERSPRVEIATVNERAQAEALAWLRSRPEREYSWVDATSFTVMRRHRIADAFAFDGDFTAAGFVELRP